jgi:hypothetical protein
MQSGVSAVSRDIHKCHKIYDKTLQTYKNWNDLKDLDPSHVYEAQYKLGYEYANCNFLNITSIISHAVIGLDEHVPNLVCEITQELKSLRIQRILKTNKYFEQNLCVILNSLPENLVELDLGEIQMGVKRCITPYLPKGLKKYKTIKKCNDQLENLPCGLEYLSITMNSNRDPDSYKLDFLPHSLFSLSVFCNDLGIKLDYLKFENLSSCLKELYLDYYNYELINLPDQLEKLIITNYYYNSSRDEQIIINKLPTNLKTFQICKWHSNKNSNIIEYPSTLEHLDIDCKVDITKLPPTLKSLSLYGFNLGENIIELPENINTVYTSDDYIEQLPAHVKRVIIIIKHPGGTASTRVRVGDVLFEIESFNTDECFKIY